MAKRAAIFISGRGSNMMALVEASKTSDLPLEFVLVFSNIPDAAGLDWAEAKGVPVASIDHRPFGKDRRAHEQNVQAILDEYNIEFICLAGYMRVLSAEFVAHWSGRMINIHPSLLPEFKGLDTHERALMAKVPEHGCTVHWVTAGVDEGDIIAQTKIAVLAEDTVETLSKRVLVEEHKLYPAAIQTIKSLYGINP